MKAQLTKSVLILVIGLTLTSSLFAQNTLAEFTKNEYALENLINGIHSENEGVRKSSIYFAGKYKVKEAAQDLINQLRTEENPSIKILIALALFEMDSRDGLEAIKKLGDADDDPKVKRMASFIYDEYVNSRFNGKVSSK